jgi:hypothetical protein
MSQQPVSTPAVPELPPQLPATPPDPDHGAAQLDPRRLWAGAAVSVASYLAAFVFSIALAVLLLFGIAAGQGTVVPALDGALSEQETPDAWSQLFQLAAQLVAMAHLGAVDTVFQGTVFFGTLRGEALAYAVPLTVLLVSALGVYFGSRLAEQKIPSGARPQLLLQSAVTGVVYSLLVNGLAAAAAVRFPGSNGFSVEPISAENPWSVVVAFFLGAGLAALSRNGLYVRCASSSGPVSPFGKLNLPVAAVTVQTVLFSAVAVPAVWITAVVAGGWTALLSGPLWIGNAAGYSFVAGHVGGVHVLMETSQVLGGQEGRSEDYTVYGFGADAAGAAAAGAAWGALALALACTVATGVAVLLRRGRVASADVLSWVPVPAAFLALGLLLLPLLTAQANFKFSGLASGEYLMAPAWWSPAVFLAWGLLVEVCARFLAPSVLRFVPARLQRLARVLPFAPIATPATSQGGATVPAGTPESDPQTHEASGYSAGPAGDGAAPEGMPARELSAKAKKRVLVALTAVGAVVVLVVGSLVAVNAVKAGPDKPVGEYVQALVDGDAEKALAILDPDIPNEDRELLTNKVFGAAENRIEGFSVISSKVSGESAVVRVELRQGGRKYEQAFSLFKSRPEFLDDHWKLGGSPLQRISISADAPVSALSVNGVAVATGQGNTSAFGTNLSLPAFPGAYSVGLPESEKHLAAAEQEVLVPIGAAGQAPETARLTVQASESLRTETTRQVTAALAGCEKSTELEPEGCPFYTFAFGDVRNVKWSVDSEPDYTMQRSFDGAWRLSGSTPGKASVSYERNASFSKARPEWEKETRKVDFYVRGSVSVASDNVVVKLSRF